MVREAPVGLQEAWDGVDVDALQHRWQVHARHAVRGIQHHAQATDCRGIHEAHTAVHEPVEQAVVHRLGAWGGRRAGLTGQCEPADLRDPGIPRQRQCARGDHLHTGVRGRVVAGGDGRAGVVAALVHREVEHLGGGQPQRGHIGPGRSRPADERGTDAGRRQAHVVTHRHAARTGDGDERPAHALGALLVDLLAVEAADVVRLEYGRVQRHAPNPGLSAA